MNVRASYWESVYEVLTVGASLLCGTHPTGPVIIGEFLLVNRFHSVNNAGEVSGAFLNRSPRQNPSPLSNFEPAKICRAGVDNCPVVVICIEDAVVTLNDANLEMAWKECASVRKIFGFIFFASVKIVLRVFNANFAWITSFTIFAGDAISGLERYCLVTLHLIPETLEPLHIEVCDRLVPGQDPRATRRQT